MFRSNSPDPFDSFFKALGWLFLFAVIGAISVLGWTGYGLYLLFALI